LKILLVEDNLLNQKVVMFNLKKRNYDIVAVTNGMDAIENIKNSKFDLVLMDIMLPEKIRMIENEKGVKNPVPIIALTANTLDNDRQKCIQVGMNEYLSKPFTGNQLIEIIEKFVQLDDI